MSFKQDDEVSCHEGDIAELPLVGPVYRRTFPSVTFALLCMMPRCSYPTPEHVQETKSLCLGRDSGFPDRVDFT